MLFLPYIDGLRCTVLEAVALFADDVSLISSHHNKQVTTTELQRAAIAVGEIRNPKKVVLNADKCKVEFLFLTDANKARIMLYFMNRSFTCPTKETFVPLYSALVRSHL